MQQKAEQSKSGPLRNQSSIMPDSYVVSSSLNQRMKNLNTPSETLVESWKFRCQKQCLAQHMNSRGETCRTIGKHRTKYVCIVDADEFMRMRLEGVPHRYHEDHISAKGINSLSHYNLVHKFVPMPQALEIPDAKAAVEKELENWIKYQHGSCKE